MAFPLSTQRLDVPGQNGGAEFLTLVSLEPKCALVTISAKQEECNFTVFEANIIMHILTIAIYSQIHSTTSSSSPHVLSHISVSLDRHAPLCTLQVIRHWYLWPFGVQPLDVQQVSRPVWKQINFKKKTLSESLLFFLSFVTCVETNKFGRVF